MRTLVWVILSVAVACGSTCRQPVTASSVAAELVEAGCVLPSGTLAQSVQADLDGGPPWLACLMDGGSVAACGGCP